MSEGKELMHDLIRKQKDCEFSLRFFLQKKGNIWKNSLTMLKLVKKGTRDEVNYDYGEYVLAEKILNIQEELDTISKLYPENDEKGKLVVPGYDEFIIDARRELRLVSSKQRSVNLRDHWPTLVGNFEVEQDRKANYKHGELLREGFPYYPSMIEAAVDFFELETEHFGSQDAFYVVIADYRSRIKSLKLIFSKAELVLDSPGIPFKNLVVKVFAKFHLEMISLPDIYPESETVKFDIGFRPDILSVALLFRQDNVKIDGKEFSIWREEEAGVFIERPEEEILSLMRSGESQDLEYKYDVIDKNQKTDLVESVVAFLNTNSGIIFVGVSDDGSVVGSRKSAEDIQKLIHDSCDPPPKNIKVEERKIGENKVIVVEVPEGDSKPYQSKKNKNFYVRHDATDMKMERSELIQLLEEKE